MKVSEAFITIFFTVIMAFIIPHAINTILDLGFSSGAGLILNQYHLFLILASVIIVLGGLYSYGK